MCSSESFHELVVYQLRSLSFMTLLIILNLIGNLQKLFGMCYVKAMKHYTDFSYNIKIIWRNSMFSKITWVSTIVIITLMHIQYTLDASYVENACVDSSKWYSTYQSVFASSMTRRVKHLSLLIPGTRMFLAAFLVVSTFCETIAEKFEACNQKIK